MPFHVRMWPPAKPAVPRTGPLVASTTRVSIAMRREHASTLDDFDAALSAVLILTQPAPPSLTTYKRRRRRARPAARGRCRRSGRRAECRPAHLSSATDKPEPPARL